MAKSGFTKIPSADAVSKYLGKSNIASLIQNKALTPPKDLFSLSSNISNSLRFLPEEA